MDEQLMAEWKNHRSGLAVQWQASMFARKKISRATFCENAVRKDMHLIEDALAADRIIVSLDDEASRLFLRLGEHVPEVAAIRWVNPLRTSADELRRR